jgi:hypothetical protein
MSNHLSEEQLAKCFAGQSTDQERQHLVVCGECSAELDRFRSSISLFRSALSDRVESRIAVHPSSEIRPATANDTKWRWALVAATALVLALVPFVGIKTEIVPHQAIGITQSDTDADALMRAVQLQLSRTIPEPMEPVIALLPTEESPTPTRGAQ